MTTHLARVRRGKRPADRARLLRAHLLGDGLLGRHTRQLLLEVERGLQVDGGHDARHVAARRLDLHHLGGRAAANLCHAQLRGVGRVAWKQGGGEGGVGRGGRRGGVRNGERRTLASSFFSAFSESRRADFFCFTSSAAFNLGIFSLVKRGWFVQAATVTFLPREQLAVANERGGAGHCGRRVFRCGAGGVWRLWGSGRGAGEIVRGVGTAAGRVGGVGAPQATAQRRGGSVPPLVAHVCGATACCLRLATVLFGPRCWSRRLPFPGPHVYLGAPTLPHIPRHTPPPPPSRPPPLPPSLPPSPPRCVFPFPRRTKCSSSILSSQILQPLSQFVSDSRSFIIGCEYPAASGAWRGAPPPPPLLSPPAPAPRSPTHRATRDRAPRRV
jgi:hypothetical protein